MNKTESLNFDGAKNPRHTEQKDRSVDAQEFERSRTTRRRKKSNKLLLWCARCCGKKKKEEEEDETEKKDKKKSAKKSIFKKLKKSRCWGRRKKKDKDSREGEEADEKRDSSSYESRAGTSARDGKGRLIVDKSDSRISFEERRRSRTERSKEKKYKPGRDSTRPEKSVSYADTRDDDKNREKKRGDEVRERYDESLRDITKSCCYLCTENSLAIAAAMAPQPVRSDKSVEADVPEMLEKSCSPIKLAVHVRTVKSLIRVKVRDTCTSYVEIPEDWKPTRAKKKRKKFRIFPKVKRTECPVRRTVGCVTENSTKLTNNSKPKEKRTFEPCCKDKAV